MPETKEHGFLFKAEMIRAMLAGDKIQTRRVVTAHNSLIDGTGKGIRDHWPHLQWDKAWVDPGPSPVGNQGPYWMVPCNRPGYCDEAVHRVYPRVMDGDSIYARETWTTDLPHECDTCDGLGCELVGYRADGAVHQITVTMWDDPMSYSVSDFNDSPKWRSPLHMPRKFARIVRPVTGVRAARVGDIDNNDAEAEGTPDLRTLENNWDMRDCFIALWDSINGGRKGMSFADSPPVWIYEWEPLK